MRMRCLRILPEICASTMCSLPSSRTLKNAFGCLSTINPSAGIKSSLDNRCSPLLARKGRACLRTVEKAPGEKLRPEAFCNRVAGSSKQQVSSESDRRAHHHCDYHRTRRAHRHDLHEAWLH